MRRHCCIRPRRASHDKQLATDRRPHGCTQPHQFNTHRQRTPHSRAVPFSRIPVGYRSRYIGLHGVYMTGSLVLDFIRAHCVIVWRFHELISVLLLPIASGAASGERGRSFKLPPPVGGRPKICNMCVLSLSWNFVSHDKYIARPSSKEPR